MQTVLIAKRSSYLTMAVALVLELTPRNAFDNELAGHLLDFLLASSTHISQIFKVAETHYNNYGAKFVLSNTLLVAVFLMVSFALVVSTAKTNPRLPLNLDQRQTMYNRIFSCIVLVAALLTIQIIFPGFYLTPGGRFNLMPILWKGVFWCALQWLIVVATVTLRRGAWENAK